VTFPGGLAFFGLTRTGVAYLALVALVSLAAVRAGDNALYALLALLASALVVSSLISRHALKQLSLTVRTPDRIFAGDRVVTRVSLTNLKRFFPTLAISVEEVAEGAAGAGANPPSSGASDPSAAPRAAYFPMLRAGETRSERLTQAFPRRGWRRQSLRVSTRFPFGFFHRQDPLPSQRLLVYPALGEIPEALRGRDLFAGQLESRTRGEGDGFYAIREHRDGEGVRVIDWKATAKARRLMAREYAREDEVRCLLFLDTSAPSEGDADAQAEDGDDAAGVEDDAPFEAAVSLAAGIAAHLLGKGALVELRAGEAHVPAGGGTAHLHRILEALAVARRRRGATPDMRQLLSCRGFKVLLTPRPAEGFPAEVRRAAHVIPFDAVRR
jgi:uncharacterized protein (DUF58 family)